MATWQFDLHLLPKERLMELVGTHPVSISRELLDETRWWDGKVDPELLDADLASFLRKSKSWHPEIAVWGEEDGNRIDVIYENNNVVEIFVRIDLRQLDRGFVIALVRLAKKYDCVFVTSTMRVLEPTLNNLIKAMEESDAHRFVDDPKGFLESL